MKLLKVLLLAWFVVYASVEFFPVYSRFALTTFLISIVLGLCWSLIHPRRPIINRQNYYSLAFLTFWLGYSLLSYVWAHDQVQSILYSIWILRYLFIFWLFSHVFRNRWLLDRFHIFLILMVLAYLGTATYEMLTWNHLPSSRYHAFTIPIPTGPFFNENNLAAFLLLFSPFLLFLPKFYRRIWLNPLILALIFFIIGIMVFQGSRIAIIGMLGMLLHYFIWHVRWKMKVVTILILFMLGYGLSLRFEGYSRIAASAVKQQLQSIGEERQSIRMSSIKIRTQLIHETVDMLSGSAGLGVGGGNFETVMLKGAKYRTGGIINPHSYLMELLGNFGVLVFWGFIALYVHWLYRLYIRYRRSEGRQRNVFLMYLVSLLLFIPTSSLPSSIRWDYFIWIYFAAVNAFAYDDRSSNAPSHSEPAEDFGSELE